MASDKRPDVDPERDRSNNPFDHDEGSSGQSYSREREEAMRQADPSGAVNANPASSGDGAGRRASVDPRTGEAMGSGAEAAEDPARKPGAWRPGSGKNAVPEQG
ncbi:hypothetical protein [Sphingomonas jeddahensis]|uniref:Uncharacterized protein n=1 Tax=Sphingomonas jeddahensis TaxID=1915074 RepID=A0A1V2ERP2_9SPHN|nr:hypothetical protein [Sphingomonas jeddahensis]ONF95336.1 hypothetical protein SPHI_24280 [Sphingomonas jeddahensis]